MNKLTVFILVSMGLGLMILGFVFIIAYEADAMNLYTGVGMVVVGLMTMIFGYMGSRKVSQQTVVQQTYNVSMGGSGQMDQRHLKCRTCGAPLEEKDLTLKDGAMMFKCSYCGAVGTFEERPKW